MTQEQQQYLMVQGAIAEMSAEERELVHKYIQSIKDIAIAATAAHEEEYFWIAFALVCLKHATGSSM